MSHSLSHPRSPVSQHRGGVYFDRLHLVSTTSRWHAGAVFSPRGMLRLWVYVTTRCPSVRPSVCLSCLSTVKDYFLQNIMRREKHSNMYRVVNPSKKVPDLNCGVQDLLLKVVDLKQEVPDLRSGGIRPNLTPGRNQPMAPAGRVPSNFGDHGDQVYLVPSNFCSWLSFFAVHCGKLSVLPQTLI